MGLGAVTLTIHQHVIRLGKLEAELRDIAGRVDGVLTVETEVGEKYHQSNVYRRHDFTMPSKVLLVDDEREFVRILSERLITCDISGYGKDPAVQGLKAYDLLVQGESGLVSISGGEKPCFRITACETVSNDYYSGDGFELEYLPPDME